MMSTIDQNQLRPDEPVSIRRLLAVIFVALLLVLVMAAAASLRNLYF